MTNGRKGKLGDWRGLKLPRRRILRGKGAFERVFSSGKVLHGRYVSCFFVGGEEELRVGFAVSRRVRRKVDRNRAKRRVREAFRRCQYSFPRHGEAVLLARESVLDAEWKDLLTDVEHLGQKIGRVASGD